MYTPYPGLSQLDYDSLMHYGSSDHKPVTSTFELRMTLINDEKRSEIVKKLLHEMDSKENASRPIVEVDTTEIVCQDLRVLEVIEQCLTFKNSGNGPVAWEVVPLDDSKLDFVRTKGEIMTGMYLQINGKRDSKCTEFSQVLQNTYTSLFKFFRVLLKYQKSSFFESSTPKTTLYQ